MIEGRNKARAWAEFWARQSGSDGGCLPQQMKNIEEAQRAAWHNFSSRLPENAKVLDLATGNGRVLAWLLNFKNNINAVGIDLSPHLPPSPNGTEIHCGVAMERLPFADDSFDVVTSQFGFEYGDCKLTAREINRVLTTGGRAGLMLHRGDGPILQHNVHRRAQIAWVINETGLLERVRAAANEGPTALREATELAAARARYGERRWGHGSAAWEIPEAIRQTLMLGSNGPREKLHETLDAIERQARSEVERIDCLAEACSAADDRDALRHIFTSAGLAVVETIDVAENSGRRFASLIVLETR